MQYVLYCYYLIIYCKILFVGIELNFKYTNFLQIFGPPSPKYLNVEQEFLYFERKNDKCLVSMQKDPPQFFFNSGLDRIQAW